MLPVDAGIPRLGFVVCATHRLVKARKVHNAHRRLRARLAAYHEGKISFGELDASIETCPGNAPHPSCRTPPGDRDAVENRTVEKTEVHFEPLSAAWAALSGISALDGRRTHNTKTDVAVSTVRAAPAAAV